jgi:hypothetical protein
MAHDVFISHSHKDKVVADAMCTTLEANGVRCWIAPRDITPSMEWGESIVDAIENARIMVLVFSADANASPQIRKEMERAVNHGVAILPLRIENVLPGKALAYFIGNVQWFDAFTPPLEAHFQNLAGTVKMLVARMESGEVLGAEAPIQPIAPPKLNLSEPAPGAQPPAAKPQIHEPADVKGPQTPRPTDGAPRTREFGSTFLSEGEARQTKVSRTRSAWRWILPVAAVLVIAALAAIYFVRKSKEPPEFAVEHTLTGHTDNVYSVAFSPDGHMLASASWDHTVKLWDVSTGSEVRTLTDTDAVFSAVFSPDGKTIATGGAAPDVKLWEVATGRELNEFKGLDPRVLGQEGEQGGRRKVGVISLAFSPDGRMLASTGLQGNAKVWNVASGEVIRTMDKVMDFSVTYSPDGLWLASGGADNDINLWSTATGREGATMTGVQNVIYSIAFSPDSKALASGSGDGSVILWDVVTGREIRTFSGDPHAFASVAFSPDGRWLASAGLTKTVHIWDVATGRQTSELSGHTEGINSVTFSRDGNWLASGGADKTIKLWRRTN